MSATGRMLEHQLVHECKARQGDLAQDYDYDEVRPHGSLKVRTPKEFAESMAGLY